MCIPAKAVNPGQPSDFHEVKVSKRFSSSFKGKEKEIMLQLLSPLLSFLFLVEIKEIQEKDAKSGCQFAGIQRLGADGPHQRGRA